MLTSLAILFLSGLALGHICQRLGLPRIIGMLAAGILTGPYCLGLLGQPLLAVSSELRRMALVIILIRAGLSLNIEDLKKVGRPAVLLSFLPATFEILAMVLLAPAILGVNRAEAAVIGAVLGAVSPAVVVPRMVKLMDEGWGTAKKVPQLILAGASLDDVFVIVLFTTFTALAQGKQASVIDFVNIPVSIVLGLAMGWAAGKGLARLFDWSHARGNTVRGSVKVVVILSVSFLMLAIEELLEGVVAVSGLLAVMSIAMALGRMMDGHVSARLKDKFNKLWLAAEVMLFVLVGAAVDIRFTMEAGAGAVLLILLGLVFRSAGTWLSVSGTWLGKKGRLYCVIAYLPKATVQAAIGAVPLGLGMPCGPIVLSAAVISILLTAPLGAIGMDVSYKKLLEKE